MGFINNIVSALNDVSDYFYDIYREVYDWTYPFWLAAPLFYYISRGFNHLAWDFYDFGEWVDDVADRVRDILDFSDIWDYFDYWFNRAAWAWDWVLRAWDNVWDIVNDWWSYTRYTVLAWVDEAKSYADALVVGVTNWLASLQEAWDSFKGRIPTIDEVILWWGNWTGNVTGIISTWWTGTLTEVKSLINSAFLEREPFWAGWQDWRDKVTEFFSDPVEFLWARFTDWFLGPEV